jgi:hypothetical protein
MLHQIIDDLFDQDVIMTSSSLCRKRLCASMHSFGKLDAPSKSFVHDISSW